MFSPRLDVVTRIFLNGANMLVVDDMPDNKASVLTRPVEICWLSLLEELLSGCVPIYVHRVEIHKKEAMVFFLTFDDAAGLYPPHLSV